MATWARFACNRRGRDGEFAIRACEAVLALALAAATGTALHVENIRAARWPPGLARTTAS